MHKVVNHIVATRAQAEDRKAGSGGGGPEPRAAVSSAGALRGTAQVGLPQHPSARPRRIDTHGADSAGPRRRPSQHAAAAWHGAVPPPARRGLRPAAALDAELRAAVRLRPDAGLRADAGGSVRADAGAGPDAGAVAHTAGRAGGGPRVSDRAGHAGLCSAVRAGDAGADVLIRLSASERAGLVVTMTVPDSGTVWTVQAGHVALAGQ